MAAALLTRESASSARAASRASRQTRPRPWPRLVAASLRKDLGVQGKALFVPLGDEQNLELAARNLPGVNVVRALGVSIVDLLDNNAVLISEEGLKKLTEVLAA